MPLDTASVVAEFLITVMTRIPFAYAWSVLPVVDVAVAYLGRIRNGHTRRRETVTSIALLEKKNANITEGVVCGEMPSTYEFMRVASPSKE